MNMVPRGRATFTTTRQHFCAMAGVEERMVQDGRDDMRNLLLVALSALVLAGCQTMQQRNAGTGALLGGATGAVIGGVAGGSAGSALAGGVIGAAAGGLLGAAVTPPEPCYIRTRSGRLRRVSC
jgi:hypothetical protein